VSNFEIAVAKLKETLRNIKFATLCRLIDIMVPTPLGNIEQVRDLHFWHRDKKYFRRKFHDYSAAWDLKIEYSGA